MSVEIAGFVDEHTHLLARSGQTGCEDEPGGIRSFHERCAADGTTPIDAHFDDPRLLDLANRIRTGLEVARSTGIVRICEAGITNWVFLDILRELREAGPLPVRVGLLVGAGLAEKGMPERLGDGYLEVLGVKFYSDGWLGPRTCALTAPFLDEPWNSGLLFETAEHLAARVSPFAEAGWTIATHAIGDRALDAVIDAYEKVFGSSCKEMAPRIEHVQIAREDQLDRMAQLGIVACIQPGFGYDDREQVARGLGTRWPLAYRWSVYKERGVQIVTGSDYPVDTLAPLAGLWKLLSNPFDDLSPTTALGLMTDPGSGRVRLSADPRTVGLDELLGIEVEQVSLEPSTL